MDIYTNMNTSMEGDENVEAFRRGGLAVLGMCEAPESVHNVEVKKIWKRM